MKQVIALLLAGAATCACSTTDFSTPVVNLQSRLVADSSRVCVPSTRTDDLIDRPSVDNARALIQNFILVYRCRSREAANGRQFFQLPAFFATAGAAAAGAFGGGSDWGIAGGVLSSFFNAGNSYYSPQRQAEIFDSALDALTCIQTEAVGVDPIIIERTSPAASGEGGGGEGDSAVHTSPAAQYYDLIRASLFSVERVTAQRLRTIGTYDPAGVVAEITALNREVEEAPSQPLAGESQANGEGGGGAGDDDDLRTVRIELRTLQPKLQRCVVRAKI